MIKIGFSTSNSFWSKIIRYVTNSDVSHAFILYYNELLDQNMVLDVQFKDFVSIPFELFKKDNKIIYLFNSETDLIPGVRVVSKWLGSSRYDWRTFASYVRWFKKLKRLPIDNPSEIICVEMVIHALRISNFPKSHELNPKDTSPKQLLEFMINSGSIEILLEEL